MPSTIKIRVIRAILPIMDTTSLKTDSYLTIKFSHYEILTTSIKYKTLHPIWNEDFRIEVNDDIVLQDNIIEFKIYDKDNYSSDGSIGVVYIDLFSLLLPNAGNKIAGWFPIYDTIKGLQGKLLLIIKLQFFGDINPFKDSAAGISIYGLSFPHKHCVHGIHGFVEELITSDDPEYSWSDFFQTSRTSNESRQLLLYSLSSKMYRNVGRKALEVNGNSVLGFNLSFDLESSSGGLVVRGYGTACTIHKLDSESADLNPQPVITKVEESTSPLAVLNNIEVNTSNNAIAYENATDEKEEEVEEKEEKPPRWFTGQVQFLTLVSFPLDVHMSLGGIVSARSVKHLGYRKIDQSTRDSWWLELRDEIKSHANALHCSSVLGYTETATIFEDICVLSAYGTAANCGRLRTCGLENLEVPNVACRLENADVNEKIPDFPKLSSNFSNTNSRHKNKNANKRRRLIGCSACHIPYSKEKAPFKMNLVPCEICKKRYVPEILLTTIEPPANLPIAGIGQLIEARVCRNKKKSQGEQNAILISEAIPFLEYDLHRQLVYKMRVLGLNAAFRLSMQLSIGPNLIIGTASATAVYALPLPCPPVLKITRHIEVKDAEDADLFELQRKIMAISEENHDQLKADVADWIARHPKLQRRQTAVPMFGGALSSGSLSGMKFGRASSGTGTETSLKKFEKYESSSSSSESDSTDSDDVDVTDNSRLTFVLHIDDDADEDIMLAILDPKPPPEIFFCNTETPPGLTCSTSTVQMISTLRRVQWVENVASHRLNQQFSSIFHDLYASIAFKARIFTPCCISGMSLFVSIPYENTIDIGCTASISMIDNEDELGITDEKYDKLNNSLAPFLLPPTLSNPFNKDQKKLDDNIALNPDSVSISIPNNSNSPLFRPANSYIRNSIVASESALFNDEEKMNMFPKDESFVEITPLSFIPHASVEHFLGRVQIHLIKESWTYKEEGGLGQFAHVFLTEAQAIARANVAARGGNALLGYRLNECRFIEPSKNQAYSIISLSGDAVKIVRNDNEGMMGVYLQNRMASETSI